MATQRIQVTASQAHSGGSVTISALYTTDGVVVKRKRITVRMKDAQTIDTLLSDMVLGGTTFAVRTWAAQQTLW